MIIETRPAYPDKIHVQFEHHDLVRRLSDGSFAWELALKQMKQEFPYPIGEFSHLHASWLIDKTNENMDKISKIKNEYFVDKNQIALNF